MSGRYVAIIPWGGYQYDLHLADGEHAKRITTGGGHYASARLASRFLNLGTWDTTGMTDTEVSEALALIEEAVQ